MWEYIFTFIVGGVITTSIVAFEKSQNLIISGVVALLPIFTWLSYLFFGLEKNGPQEVAWHSKFVLIGTIVAWIPYMLIIHFLAPKIGVYKSIALAIFCFLVLSTIYVLAVNKFHLI